MDNSTEYVPNQVELSPEEHRDLLIGFMGQTYRDVHQFDKNLVSHNSTLAPKSQEFHSIAEKLLGEVDSMNPNKVPTSKIVGTLSPSLHQSQTPVPLVHMKPQPQATNNYIEADQMLFNFDNSATAQSIQNSINSLIERMIKIEKTLNTLETNLTKHTKQNASIIPKDQ